jgi:hypothetical protein
LWIRFDLMLIRIRIRIQGFDDQKLEKKITAVKFFDIFLDRKLQFTYPSASIKDAQATGEAFSLQKRTSSITFFYICG